MTKSVQKKTATPKSAGSKVAKDSARVTAANDQAQEAKKSKKLRTAIVLIVGLVGVVGLFALNAGSIAKITVEKIASRTLGVPVSIGGLEINLQEQQINVTSIKISNPPGYQGDKAMTIESVSIAADTISQDMLVLEKVQVSGTGIYLEVLPDRTNLIEIHGNLDKKASAREQAERPVKVMVRTLVIDDAVLYPAVTLAGGTLQPTTLPDIRINNIGSDSGGMLASEAMGVVAERVIIVAMRAAAEQRFLRGMDDASLQRIESALGLSSGLFKNLGSKVKGMFGN